MKEKKEERKKKERLCCLGFLWGEREFKCRFGVTVICRFGPEANSHFLSFWVVNE